MAASKGARIQNLTRKRMIFTCTDGQYVVLGDKIDADGSETIPETGRNDKYQPNPLVTLDGARWEALGAENQRILREHHAAGRVSLQEL